MKCPLMQRIDMTKPGPIDYGVADCLKAEYAWWMDSEKMCSVRGIARFLALIDNELKLGVSHDYR